MLLWRGVYAAAVTLSAMHVNLVSGGGLLKAAAARTPGAIAVNRRALLTLTATMAIKLQRYGGSVNQRPLLRVVPTLPHL